MRGPLLLTAVAATLVLVPVSTLHGQSTRGQPHGDLKLDCAECHVPEGWDRLSKTPTFRHDTTEFTLESAHAKASCRSCHQSLVFNQVGTACADCHKDAHRGEMGFQCETCHTPTTWTNQREMAQVHNRTRFPLFAVHARLDCMACHRSQQPYEYKNTPAECGNCHLSTYLATTNPNHSQSGFSRRCPDCHNVTSPTWQGARFSHPAPFPLAGGHAGLACARCHPGGTHTGTPSACVSCHQKDYAATSNPNHTAGGFPTTCQNCHSITAWRLASLDHDGRYFPIYSGRHRGQWSSCAECHVNPGNYKAFECILCHAHFNKANVDGDHRGVNGYSYASSACYRCHLNGRADATGGVRRLP